MVPLIRNCRTLGICLFSPPFLLREIIGPLSRAIRPSFSLMRHFNFTFFLSNLAVVFFKGQPWLLYSSVLWQKSGRWMASTNIHFEKCKMYQKVKEYILRLKIQQYSSFMSLAHLYSGSFDKKLQDPCSIYFGPSFLWLGIAFVCQVCFIDQNYDRKSSPYLFSLKFVAHLAMWTVKSAINCFNVTDTLKWKKHYQLDYLKNLAGNGTFYSQCSSTN